MKAFTKKRVAVLAVIAVAAVSAVAAYAYFTGAGSGTGTFSSGQIGTVTITSDAVGPLYPQTDGSATTPITLHVKNNGSGQQYVGQITGAVDPNSVPTNCDASAFSIPAIAAPGYVGGGQTVSASGSIILNDNGHNQNACANHTFTINWSSAAP